MGTAGTDNRITALYCRLSQDDGNNGDSMSITSQKAILEAKAKEMGFTGCQFYVDDGYSGTNSNRPAFQKLLKDVEDGRIGVVMTKDLSRLARNYLESGTYIEMFFPQHGVRYIAVNDGIDSLNSGGMDITPFKNILNEFYSRDISKKVKTGRLIRAKQGKYMGTTAPFGLKKDPADKNHLIIDEETAPTVRRIFELALKGYGNNKIGKILYTEKVLKPACYKKEYFGKYLIKPDDPWNWKQETIVRILRNPVYKGYMWVAGTNKRSFRQRTGAYIPIKDRTIIPAEHEAIVSEEVWDAVQGILDRHTRIRKCQSGYDNIFRGILRCPDCGRSLLVHTDTRFPDKDVMEKTYFQCSTYRSEGKIHCTQHRIEASDLEETVLNDIKEHAAKVIKDRERFVRKVMQGLGFKRKENAEAIRTQITQLNAKIQDADGKYVRLYDDMTGNVISESKFKLLSSRIEAEQERAREEISKFEERLASFDTSEEAVNSLAGELAGYAEIKKLSAELLNRLVDKIEVSEKSCVGNEKVQKVTVYYKFAGVIE